MFFPYECLLEHVLCGYVFEALSTPPTTGLNCFAIAMVWTGLDWFLVVLACLEVVLVDVE